MRIKRFSRTCWTTTITGLASAALILGWSPLTMGSTAAHAESPTTPPSATGSPTGAASAELDAENFHLTRTEQNPVLDELDGELETVTVSDVVASANREGTSCAPDAAHLQAGFCWNGGDNQTNAWYPQGVTTTADADTSGSYDGQEVVLTSWYDSAHDGIDKGARVSFIDWSNPDSPDYRHVLLVEPYTDDNGDPSFREVDIHAGGAFWYGDYLYVADTWNGLRVFDMRHLWAVATGDSNIVGRQPDGEYHAFNYAYVLPQTFAYDHTSAGEGDDIRFSFAGLDRTSSPHSITVGEYENPGDGSRLFSFDIGEDGLLVETDEGYAAGDAAYQTDVRSMQGALSLDGAYYISRSNGSGTKGDLATYVPGNLVEFHTGAQPIGPEDLAYRESADELWSLAEYPGDRSVYAMRASAF